MRSFGWYADRILTTFLVLVVFAAVLAIPVALWLGIWTMWKDALHHQAWLACQ